MTTAEEEVLDSVFVSAQARRAAELAAPAHALVDAEEYRAAIALAKEALNICGDCAAAFNIIGRCADSPEAALVAFQNAKIALKKSLHDSMYRSYILPAVTGAAKFHGQGAWDSAILPEYVRAVGGVADGCRILGRDSEALKEYLILWRLDRHWGPHRINSGFMMYTPEMCLKLGFWNEAIGFIESYSGFDELLGDDPEILLSWSMSYLIARYHAARDSGKEPMRWSHIYHKVREEGDELYHVLAAGLVEASRSLLSVFMGKTPLNVSEDEHGFLTIEALFCYNYESVLIGPVKDYLIYLISMDTLNEYLCAPVSIPFETVLIACCGAGKGLSEPIYEDDDESLIIEQAVCTTFKRPGRQSTIFIKELLSHMEPETLVRMKNAFPSVINKACYYDSSPPVIRLLIRSGFSPVSRTADEGDLFDPIAMAVNQGNCLALRTILECWPLDFSTARDTPIARRLARVLFSTSCYPCVKNLSPKKCQRCIYDTRKHSPNVSFERTAALLVKHGLGPDHMPIKHWVFKNGRNPLLEYTQRLIMVREGCWPRPKVTEKEKNTCRHCRRRISEIHSCSKCENSEYCSKECRKYDWYIHKNRCGEET